LGVLERVLVDPKDIPFSAAVWNIHTFLSNSLFLITVHTYIGSVRQKKAEEDATFFSIKDGTLF
jgi:hypothetical protein